MENGSRGRTWVKNWSVAVSRISAMKAVPNLVAPKGFLTVA